MIQDTFEFMTTFEGGMLDGRTSTRKDDAPLVLAWQARGGAIESSAPRVDLFEAPVLEWSDDLEKRVWSEVHGYRLVGGNYVFDPEILALDETLSSDERKIYQLSDREARTSG